MRVRALISRLVGSGPLWVFARFAISGSLMLAFQLGAMRIYTLADIGIISVLMAVASLCAAAADLGAGVAAIHRQRAIVQEEVAATCGVLLTVLIPLVAGLWWYGDGQGISAMIACILLVTPLQAVRILAVADADRRLDFKVGATLEICESALLFGGAMILGGLGVGAWGFVLAVVMRALLGWLWTRNFRTWSMVPRWSAWTGMVPLWGYGLRFHSGSILTLVRVLAGPILLGSMAGFSAVGLVDRAVFIAGAPLLFLGMALNRILFPLLVTRTDDAQRTVFERSLWMSAALDKLAFLAILLLIGPLCERFLSSSYVALPSLVWVATIPGMVLGSFGCLVWPLFSSKGRTDLTLLLQAVSAGISWLLMPPLVSYFGLWGAMAVNLALWLPTFIPYLLVKRLLPGVRIMTPLIMTSVACGVALMGALGLRWACSPGLSGTIAIVSGAMGIYGVILMWMAPVERGFLFARLRASLKVEHAQ
jgi:O-antigen/teichoic acid export membrane protein